MALLGEDRKTEVQYSMINLPTFLNHIGTHCTLGDI